MQEKCEAEKIAKSEAKTMQEMPKTPKNLKNNDSDSDIGVKLHGEMLRFLRENQEMRLLMVCREIKTIKVSDGVAELDIDEAFAQEFADAQPFLSKFFEERGLKYCLLQVESRAKQIEKLKSVLGGNLEICN